MMLKLKLQYFGHLMQRVDSLEKTLMLEVLGAGGEGDNRGWDDRMASPTRWTWVWVNSRRWWWTGRPGVLQFVQRLGHDWLTELNWYIYIYTYNYMCMYLYMHLFMCLYIYAAATAAAAARSLQSCPTLCDPIDGSHHAPPSLGFSRQEYWSGLPFPSPVYVCMYVCMCVYIYIYIHICHIYVSILGY